MASISLTSISPKPSSPPLRSTGLNFGRKTSILFFQSSAMRIQAPLRLQICCVAKPDTVDKVTDIVKKQLALKDDASVTGETKFSELGADSLDTVEIVMRLEEEFGVTVEEENAQSITTIGEAADLIEKLQNA